MFSSVCYCHKEGGPYRETSAFHCHFPLSRVLLGYKSSDIRPQNPPKFKHPKTWKRWSSEEPSKEAQSRQSADWSEVRIFSYRLGHFPDEDMTKCSWSFAWYQPHTNGLYKWEEIQMFDIHFRLKNLGGETEGIGNRHWTKPSENKRRMTTAQILTTV